MSAASAAARFPALARHWAVLRAAWQQETERARTRTRVDETAFLPAALEVMETPPSPVGRGLLWFLMGCVAIALLWSFVGRMDVVAVAPGKLVPAGRIKIVQPSELGVVRALNVREGQRVEAGEVLVELDPTVAEAEAGQASRALMAAEIDAARARAVLAALNAPATGSERAARAFEPPAGTPPEVARVQDDLIAAQLAEYRARLAGLAQQRASAEAQASAARQEIAKLTATQPLLQQQVAARRTLAEKGYQSKLQLLDYEAALIETEKNIAIARDNERQALAGIAAARQGAAQVRQEFIGNNVAELAEAENRIAMAREDARKAGRRAGLMQLKAPVAGTVQQLKLATIGGVVQPAEPLMVIVPAGSGGGGDAEAGQAGLVAEVMILNKDIGFVRAGQEVAVKLEAFPFTDYGLIPGTLAQVSRDAVEQEGAGLVYTGRVALDCGPSGERSRRARQALALCGEVAAGMAATAEIKTGTRRIIDYFLSPIARAASEAGRER